MSFLLSICSILAYTTIAVEWINDHVYIPLYASLSSYVLVPEANLLIDGEIVLDPAVYYERNGVNRTFISVVNTSVVKSYLIDYRVTFPTYGISDIRTIYFHVVDEDPPEFLSVPTFRISLAQQLPDFTIGLTYNDNYDQIEHINLEIDATQIIKTKIGTYQIIYTIYDTSGNKTQAFSTIEIYDHLPPTITLKNEIILSFGDPFYYLDFFLIKDNYDSVCFVEIDTTFVNFNRIGSYEITIKVTDQSGNVTSMIFPLKIVDDEPPLILLKGSIMPLTVYTEITEELLSSYILSIRDNVDSLDQSMIRVTHNIDQTTLGNYLVFYEIHDLSMNITQVSLIVKIIDDIPPVIIPDHSMKFPVFSPILYLETCFQITDNYNAYDQLKITITSSIKLYQIGTYPISVEVKDTSGNVTFYRGYIEIIDDTPPTISQLADIIITDFSPNIYQSFFGLEDNYDQPQNLMFFFDDQFITYNTIGTYQAIVYVTDLSGNIQSIEVDVMIIDIIPPTLVLTHDYLVLSTEDTWLNYHQFINVLEDNYDLINDTHVIIDSTIIFGEIGLYEVTYQISDRSKNITISIMTIKIDDFESPVIMCEDMTLSQGEIFHPFSGISWSDNVEVKDVIVFPSTIDTNTPGTYEVLYIVNDTRGNQTSHLREVVILASDSTIALTAYVPLAIVVCLGIGFSIYIYKRW